MWDGLSSSGFGYRLFFYNSFYTILDDILLSDKAEDLFKSNSVISKKGKEYKAFANIEIWHESSTGVSFWYH